jgi:hypothetical protein
MNAPIRSMPETMMVDDKYEVYRVVLDYEALLEGFTDRIEDLNVSRITIDEAGEFTPGHASKILCNPPMKMLGMRTLGKMLKATGMALVLVVDDERFAPIKAQMAKRRRAVRPIGSIERPTWLITREISQNMQVLRNKKLTPRQRKMIAKRAAKARWSRARVPQEQALPQP